MWNYPDSLVIFAAGNDGPYSGSIDAPSTNKNGIAVGASLNDYNSWILYGGGDSNSESTESGSTVYSGNSMGFFSSQGPTADGRMKPDIMAPGTYDVRVHVWCMFESTVCEYIVCM
jgi:serine protease AprX